MRNSEEKERDKRYGLLRPAGSAELFRPEELVRRLTPGKGPLDTRVYGRGSLDIRVRGKTPSDTRVNGRGPLDTRVNGRWPLDTRANGRWPLDIRVRAYRHQVKG